MKLGYALPLLALCFGFAGRWDMQDEQAHEQAQARLHTELRAATAMCGRAKPVLLHEGVACEHVDPSGRAVVSTAIPNVHISY